MNCAIDAATTHQSAIGGIDDRVYLFFGDVADFDKDSVSQKLAQNFHIAALFSLTASDHVKANVNQSCQRYIMIKILSVPKFQLTA
jgi:carbamate kinase